MDRHITLFHSPQSRSFAVHVLLEELEADYTINLLNFNAAEQHRPEYLAINPMGKVPAIQHGEALVTEQAAVFVYLADLYPESRLAPAIGDALRGPYLRWMVFYDSCFEPALIARMTTSQFASPASHDNYEAVIKTLTDQLAKGRYLLGDRFTALDVLWGTALDWTTDLKLIPNTSLIRAYIDRINARPTTIRTRFKDFALVRYQVKRFEHSA